MILLLGSTGQVGGEIRRQMNDPVKIVAAGRDQADLSRPETLQNLVESLRPEIVINGAAYTAVDRAETEREASQTANAVAPAALAQSCKRIGARLIHFSTDYVFNGEKTTPYSEADAVDPVNAYGRDKLEGEQAVLQADPKHMVFRLSWVYGVQGRNFALTMLRLAREGRTIRVVGDQVGAPTYAGAIAGAIIEIVRQSYAEPDAEGGLFHLTAEGTTSWHGFAVELLQEALGAQAPVVHQITTEEFPTPARRPRYSKLSNDKLFDRFGIRLETWQAQAKRWASELSSSDSMDLK